MLAQELSLRWRAISHLTQQEAAELARLPDRRNRQSTLLSEQPPATLPVQQPVPVVEPLQGIKSLNLAGVQIRNDGKLDSKRSANFALNEPDDSFIRPFIKREDKPNIREEYAMLWYDKLAWQEYVQRLMRENMRKDEAIVRLRHELQQIRSSRRL